MSNFVIKFSQFENEISSLGDSSAKLYFSPFSNDVRVDWLDVRHELDKLKLSEEIFNRYFEVYNKNFNRDVLHFFDCYFIDENNTIIGLRLKTKFNDKQNPDHASAMIVLHSINTYVTLRPKLSMYSNPNRFACVDNNNRLQQQQQEKEKSNNNNNNNTTPSSSPPPPPPQDDTYNYNDDDDNEQPPEEFNYDDDDEEEEAEAETEQAEIQNKKIPPLSASFDFSSNNNAINEQQQQQQQPQPSTSNGACIGASPVKKRRLSSSSSSSSSSGSSSGSSNSDDDNNDQENHNNSNNNNTLTDETLIGSNELTDLSYVEDGIEHDPVEIVSDDETTAAAATRRQQQSTCNNLESRFYQFSNDDLASTNSYCSANPSLRSSRSNLAKRRRLNSKCGGGDNSTTTSCSSSICNINKNGNDDEYGDDDYDDGYQEDDYIIYDDATSNGSSSIQSTIDYDIMNGMTQFNVRNPPSTLGSSIYDRFDNLKAASTIGSSVYNSFQTNLKINSNCTKNNVGGGGGSSSDDVVAAAAAAVSKNYTLDLVGGNSQLLGGGKTKIICKTSKEVQKKLEKDKIQRDNLTLLLALSSKLMENLTITSHEEIQFMKLYEYYSKNITDEEAFLNNNKLYAKQPINIERLNSVLFLFNENRDSNYNQTQLVLVIKNLLDTRTKNIDNFLRQ